MTVVMMIVASAWGNFIFGPGTITLGLQFAFYVWLVTVTMMTIATAVEQRAHRISVAAIPLPAAPAATPPTLLARLPDKLKAGTILALQGEDHYVRVHTTAGSDLVLIRLSDAIEDMGDTPGARTHRSWWVSKSAMKSVRRDNGRITLVLANDLEVPVSRGYASEIKEAGWLAQ
jgi:DNA-binding LytR/AlgR family response regulator